MPDRQTSGTKPNPWRTGVIVGAALVLVFIATGAVLAYLDDAEPEPSAAVSDARTDVAAAPPPPVAVEDCNQHAAAVRRDAGEIAKDGLLGGAVGAGVGAAGGAIAKGGEGAGKGAGIGALVGVVGGTLYGLNEENQRSEAAARAYQECMERRGY